jgi:magnesium chelatase family protein
MLVKLNTFSLLGIDAVPVEVEVDCADIGMPKTILVGLPEAAVKESIYRIGCNLKGGTLKTPAISMRLTVPPEY